MSHITGSDSGDTIIRYHHALIFPSTFSSIRTEKKTYNGTSADSYSGTPMYNSSHLLEDYSESSNTDEEERYLLPPETLPSDDSPMDDSSEAGLTKLEIHEEPLSKICYINKS